jgi:hypothetical protein
MALDPLREFALKALLWLPASFFVWFWFASPLAWPVVHAAGAVLTGGWPRLFEGVTLHGYLMDIATHVVVNQPAADGRSGLGELVLTVNPMIYGYPLPLFAGLALATPMSAGKRSLQLAAALAAVWLGQLYGVVCETFKLLAFDAGAAGIHALAGGPISADGIALAYQFGYLILPAVLPIALWLALNRVFLGHLVGWDGEPRSGNRGQRNA